MLRRIAWSALLLAVVSFLTFLVFYVLPSTDPALLRVGRQATPDQLAAVRASLGLDEPFYEQFRIYATNVVTDFDLGYSYYAEVPVRDEILSRLPASISVALGAFVLWMAIALPVGILTALRPRSRSDRAVTGATLFFMSAPTYWLGLVVLFLFARDIGAVPVVGGAGTYVPFSESPRGWLEALILPWIVLAAAFAGLYARMIGENLRDAMAQDFVRTARAKGLSEQRIVLRHGLRAALAPIDKAHKWFVTRGDLEYTALWILYAATPLAQIEVISRGLLADREVVPQAASLNPGFFNVIYTEMLNAKKTTRAVHAALDAVDAYVAERADLLFAPIVEYLEDAGEARSATEIETYFSRQFNIDGVTTACEYLADHGHIGKASIAARLTKRSNADVQELAFFPLR